MLTQKMPRQPTVPMRMPPSTGPSAIDRPNTPSHTPIARARSAGLVNVLVMMPSAGGFSIAPPAPCSRRNAISQPRLGARLHSQDPRVNSDRPTWKITRRPIRSAAAPENISKLASTMVYPATVHCRPATLVCRLCPMAGSPTLTMVLSRPTMNSALQQTASTTARLPEPIAAPLARGAGGHQVSAGHQVSGGHRLPVRRRRGRPPDVQFRARAAPRLSPGTLCYKL